MKKILFNDKYGLTQAVLEGRKTMTRRVIKTLLDIKYPEISDWGLTNGGKACITLYEGGRPTTDIFPAYQPEEIVAVAQSYKSIHEEMMNGDYGDSKYDLFRSAMVADKAGWNNKMFVRADLTPHQIRITNIKVERLQDCSDDDILKEGVSSTGLLFYIFGTNLETFKTAKSAFAALIDKVSGAGTWERNPWVFAYSELVR